MMMAIYSEFVWNVAAGFFVTVALFSLAAISGIFFYHLTRHARRAIPRKIEQWSKAAPSQPGSQAEIKVDRTAAEASNDRLSRIPKVAGGRS